MFWSLDSPEEQTFGQLIAAYRRRCGLSQADVAPLLTRFGFRFPPQLSLLEGGTWPTQPDRLLIREFARLYSLSPREESFLLRQADILSSATEQQSIILRFASTLLEFSSPVCILNAHWQLVAWNEPFAMYYDGSPGSGSAGSTTPPSRLTDPSLHAASLAPTQPPSAISERTGTLDEAFDAAPARDLLSLKENLNFLLLLFSRRSRLRSILNTDEWNKVARFFLIRFWRTSLPLFNQHWHPSTGPAWIARASEEVRALPIPDNQEFLEMSDQIRGSLEAEVGWENPHVQLTNSYLHDRLVFHQRRWQFQVIPTVMSDARFLCLQFQHAATPLSPNEIVHQRYL